MSIRVTLNWLEKERACISSRDEFRHLFPDGVELTRAVIICYGTQFDLHWFAMHLLRDETYNRFNHAHTTLINEYHAKRRPLRDEADRKIKLLGPGEHFSERFKINGELESTLRPLYTEYQQKRALLLADVLELP